MKRRLILLFIPWIILPAIAGAPFVTDDPDVVSWGTTEINVFSNLNKSNIEDDEPYWNFLAAELDLGLFPNFQVFIMVPYSWTDTTVHANKGLGDIELGFTYQLFKETPYLPAIGISPLISVPTGDADKELGNGRIATEIPIWFQKTWGPWTSYFGGGWVINTEPGDLNYPLAGWLVQREINDALILGVEIYTQGAGTEAGSAWTALNVGGTYNFTERLGLLFSAGHSILGQSVVLGYFGFEWELED